jgi:7-cyano-7-deazaguanine synthase
VTATGSSRRAVLVFSGGLDSTTLLYHLRAAGYEVKALSADYGQRHRGRESSAAESSCSRLGIKRRTVDLTPLTGFFGVNALTNRGPDSHWAATRRGRSG